MICRNSRKEGRGEGGKEVLTVGAADGNFSQQKLNEFAECPGHRDEAHQSMEELRVSFRVCANFFEKASSRSFERVTDR